MLLDDSQVANVEIYPPGVPSIPCFFIIIIVIVIIIFFFLSWSFFPLFKISYKNKVLAVKLGLSSLFPGPHAGVPDPADTVYHMCREVHISCSTGQGLAS